MPVGRIALATFVLVFLAIAVRLAGWSGAFVSAYVIALSGFDARLYWAVGTPSHLGLAASTPVLYLSDALLAAAVISIWVRGESLRVGWLVTTLMLPALTLLLFVWGNSPEQWSGLKLYATALIAFGIGRWLSRNLTGNITLVLALACLSICTTHFIIALAQTKGIELIPSPGTADGGESAGLEGRASGLYSHPNYLGATITLLFCFLFPLATSDSRPLTRKIALAAIPLGAAATLFTLSRSGSTSVALAIALLVALGGRLISLRTRVTVVASAAAVFLLNTSFIARLQERDELDPLGGDRPYLLSVGLAQIQKAALIGTGPNYYCEIVGKYEYQCGVGFPVHNSFVYVAAELGLPLAAVVASPLLMAVAMNIQRSLVKGRLDTQSATMFAVLPGLLLIGWTQWGLVSQLGLPLWFLCFGFLASPSRYFDAGRRRENEMEPSSASDEHPRT